MFSKEVFEKMPHSPGQLVAVFFVGSLVYVSTGRRLREEHGLMFYSHCW